MHPELINIFGFSVKTYGFMLMIGFLSGVWLAMRRAARVKADPDCVLDASFFALIAGVVGARLFYVIHYWQSQFADQPNRFLAVIDIRQGGLEFLGGFLGAALAIIIYLGVKGQSLRLYLDILAPSAMWGLAVGRIGCFFNGCCFGAICFAHHEHQPRHPWGVAFPYGSPPHVRQWEDRQTTIPAELIVSPGGDLLPTIVRDSLLSMSPERRETPKRRAEELAAALHRAAADQLPAKELEAIKNAEKRAIDLAQEHERELKPLRLAATYPSRIVPSRTMSITELQDLAAASTSLPVHPSQLYATIQAALLSLLLSSVFYRRKRHGIVFALMFILYPIGRVLEEIIRADNPHDVAGLTASQSISALMFLAGAIGMFVLYKYMPIRSPFLNLTLQETEKVKHAHPRAKPASERR